MCLQYECNNCGARGRYLRYCVKRPSAGVAKCEDWRALMHVCNDCKAWSSCLYNRYQVTHGREARKRR
jgi:hypothetical protein